MTEIALLTAANLVSDAPDRRADAHLFDIQLDILRRGFAPHGLNLTPVRWIDPIDWTRFGAVLVNSAWDYQDRHEDFLATLDRIAALGVPVFNDPATVRWNIRKTYLRELEARGVPVIPTLWPEAPTRDDIVHAGRLHVAAKRYLCWKEPAYLLALSDASRQSLQLQGGPMGEAEAHQFEQEPHFTLAVRVRRYDDMGKVPGMVTPGLPHFVPLLRGFLRATPRDTSMGQAPGLDS
jgi:hypothetical protein